MFCHFIIVEWIHLSTNFLCHVSFQQLHIFSSKKKLLFIYLQRYFLHYHFSLDQDYIFLQQLFLVSLFLLLWFISRVVLASIKTSQLWLFFFNYIKLENAFQRHVLLLLRYFQSMNHTKFKLKWILMKYMSCGHHVRSTCSLLYRSACYWSACYWRHSLGCLSWETGVSNKWVFQQSWETPLFLLHCRLLTTFSHSKPQSRSLFCSTVLNYSQGWRHHFLSPAPMTVDRRSKLIQYQHFDVKFKMLKVRDSE